MAKLSKEELLAKINEKLGDNSELAIELMEDISDSLEIDTSELDSLKVKYDELVQKYRDRFVSGEEVKIEEKPEVVDEEEKVIDVKEIFDEKEDEE